MIDEVHIKGVTPIVQDTGATCWYACFQMLYQKKGLSKDKVKERIVKHQTEAQKKLKPPVADFNYMYDHGIGKQDLVPVARALQLEWGGGGNKDIGIGALLYAIDKFGPIWIAGSWNSHDHVILLIGARRGRVSDVYFLNPWLQFGGSQEITRPLSWLNRGRGQWKGWIGSIMHGAARKQADIKDYLD